MDENVFLPKSDNWCECLSNIGVKFLIKGKETFGSISDGLSNAKKRICITGWQFTTEIPLVRGTGDQKSLKELLISKADKGVQIFIILYNDPLQGKLLGLNNNRHKQTLAHKNIHVVCSRPNGQFEKLGFSPWSHHDKLIIVDDILVYLGGLDLALNRWDDINVALFDRDSKNWVGRDYYNNLWASHDAGTTSWNALKDYQHCDRETTARLPWHDVHVRLEGQKIAEYAFQFFMDRWTFAVKKYEQKKDQDTKINALLEDISKEPSQDQSNLIGCNVQLLRSFSKDSGKTDNYHSDTILKAYLRVISLAKNFIYIENQYFIGGLGYKTEDLVSALVEKANNGVPVIIVLPMFHDGDIEDTITLRVIEQHLITWEYIEKRINKDNNNNIAFYSMLSVEESYHSQIYVHSKLMIVDDKYAIIGSANINERSMFGERDTEIAALIDSTNEVWHLGNRSDWADP